MYDEEKKYKKVRATTNSHRNLKLVQQSLIAINLWLKSFGSILKVVRLLCTVVENMYSIIVFKKPSNLKFLEETERLFYDYDVTYIINHPIKE